MKSLKYPSINGLRGLSILFVICHHLQIQHGLFSHSSSLNWLNPFLEFIEDGHLGVNIFFVISGFLITSLLLQEEVETTTISLKKFYIRRSLRILPAYFFLLFIYFILCSFNIIGISHSSWLTSLTFTKYFNWWLDWFTSHLWSLSMEEQFYLLWPLVFMMGQTFRKIVVVFVLLIVPFIRYYFFHHPNSYVNELTIFTRIDAIAMGCFIAIYKNELITFLNKHWAKSFYFAITLLFILRYLPSVTGNVKVFNYLIVPFGSTHGTIANILISVIILYSIYGPQKYWHQFLNLKLMNYLGILSYSIYLWQQLFVMKSNYWVTNYPQNLFFILIAALFSYHLIEKPFLKLKQKINLS